MAALLGLASVAVPAHGMTRSLTPGNATLVADDDEVALPATARMNVLFLASDDMRMQLGVDRVPGTHTMSTPNIDAIVKKSLFLRKAQVQQAVCSPTRTSVLTSRYPDTTRVWDLYSYFRNVGGNFTTIPQLFKENGYLTLGGGKIFHPGHASGGGAGGGAAASDDGLFSWSAPFFHAPNLNYWSRTGGCDGSSPAIKHGTFACCAHASILKAPRSIHAPQAAGIPGSKWRRRRSRRWPCPTHRSRSTPLNRSPTFRLLAWARIWMPANRSPSSLLWGSTSRTSPSSLPSASSSSIPTTRLSCR
jgi:hypothetical protein